jgi:thiol-disulfide isomerase/thioredoxin
VKKTLKAEYLVGIAILFLIVVGLAILFVFSLEEPKSSEKVISGEKYVEIVNPSGFVNTDSITIEELVGKKIILVDFMTYSCINCQRTFPYLNAWYEKYKDQGLEIVAIHTPEFAFEKDIENVREAMERFGIKHPVVLDNDYATWRAYGNRFWPRKYLIDIQGNIVYDHIGEGAYEETEMKITELLSERAQFLGLKNIKLRDTLASSEISQSEIFAKSPEVYFGSERNEFLANGVSGKSGRQNFVPLDDSSDFLLNTLYLKGEWQIEPEYSEAVSQSEVIFRYNAKEVFLVASADVPTEIEVFQDNVLVNKEAGADIDSEGLVTVKESGLYKIIKNQEPGEHILLLRIKTGIKIYTFTFG